PSMGVLGRAVLVMSRSFVCVFLAPPRYAGRPIAAPTETGVERWKVKTLQDRPRLLRVHSIRDRAVGYSRATNARYRRRGFVRAPYLQRRRGRDAYQARGGRGFPPRPRGWRRAVL